MVDLAELEHLGGVRPGRLGLALAGLEPGQPGQGGGQLGGLAELAGQRHRLGVVGLRVRPAVGGRLVPGDVEQQVGQRAERGLGALVGDRLLDQLPAVAGVPQEQRSQHEPGRFVAVRIHHRPVEPAAELHSAAQQAGAILPRQHPGHPGGHQPDRLGFAVGLLGERTDPLGGQQGRGRIAQVEADVDHLGVAGHRLGRVSAPPPRWSAGCRGPRRPRRTEPRSRASSRWVRTRISGVRSSRLARSSRVRARTASPARQAQVPAASSRPARPVEVGDRAAARSAAVAATAYAPRAAARCPTLARSAAAGSSGPRAA